MTDKELLELSAKAAGINIGEWTDNGFWVDLRNTAYGPAAVHWNPLTDDGDALRLAVKLQLGVAIYDNRSEAMDGEGVDLYEHIVDEPYEATRRAIVRAAAEIGKNDPIR